jgi:hypothetical protein
VLASGLVAIFLPAAVVVAPLALLVWAVVGTGSRWMAVTRGTIASVAALPLLFPWLGIIDGFDYLEQGPDTFWEPSIVVVALLGFAALVTMVVGDRLLSTLAGWGGTLAVAGAGAARFGDFDLGTDVGLAGLVAASLGTSLVIGSGLETFARLDLPGWRRSVGALGAGAAVAVALVAAPFILPGRAGLPADRYRGLLDFAATVDGASDSRLLLVGSAASLPGESRSLDGTAYRVISVPVPTLWETRLGVERPADAALDAVLRSIVAGETVRAGEALAEFGIEWVVFVNETVLDASFDGTLDLLPLPGLDETAFVNEESAVRALTTSGTAWSWDAPGYRGEGTAGEAVLVAEAADRRWGPGEWAQNGWSNRLSAAPGVATFSSRTELRNEALFALGYLVLLVVFAMVGVGRRAR